MLCRTVNRRFGTIALLVFQAFWLNVVLPGHTRGIVTMPGWEAKSRTETAKSCCGVEKPSKETKPSPSERAAHCAVCFFAVHLFLPPVVDLRPPALELTGRMTDPQPDIIHFPCPILTYDGRAPPLA